MSLHRLLEAGVPFPEAVRLVLAPDTVADFAESLGKHAQNISGVLNGSARYPYYEIRDALAERLGVTREWLDARCPIPEPEKRG